MNAPPIAEAIGRLPRLFGWLVFSLLLLLAVFWLAPHQVPVSLYKLSLVSMAAVAGYWLDRSLFPYARPDRLFPANESGWAASDWEARATLVAASMIRRALIVAAAMLAVGLGA